MDVSGGWVKRKNELATILRDGSAIINETPDTVILTNNRATDDSQSTQTQDTVLLTRNQTLSEEDQTQEDGVLKEDQDEKGTDEQKDTTAPAETVERAQPGFMEEDCGFLMLSRYGHWLDSGFFCTACQGVGPITAQCSYEQTRGGWAFFPIKPHLMGTVGLVLIAEFRIWHFLKFSKFSNFLKILCKIWEIAFAKDRNMAILTSDTSLLSSPVALYNEVPLKKRLQSTARL